MEKKESAECGLGMRRSGWQPEQRICTGHQITDASRVTPEKPNQKESIYIGETKTLIYYKESAHAIMKA